MAGGYVQVPQRFLAVSAVVVLLGPVMALSACSDSAAPGAQKVSAIGSPTASTSTKGTPLTAPMSAAQKAALAKAAAKEAAAVKAAAAKFLANQSRGELDAAKAHPAAKAAAACGVTVGDLVAQPRGSRIGPPDVPRRGDMWRVKATSPRSPGMIIYWPDGQRVLCRH